MNENMGTNALRTLMLCHRDFQNIENLPENWKESPPDDKNLVCDCIVGIIGKLNV